MDKFAQLEKIAEMHKKGILTDEEFITEKTKILTNNANTEEKQEQQKFEKYENDIYFKHQIESNPCRVEEKDFWSWATFFGHEGRMRRSHWWAIRFTWLWFYIVAIIVVWIFADIIESSELAKIIFGILIIILYISDVYSTIVTNAKHFHDMNKSGWFQLIPFYNFICMAFLEWDKWSNRFGNPVK